MGWPRCHFGLNEFHFIRVCFLFFSLPEEVDLPTWIILALDIFQLVEMLFGFLVDIDRFMKVFTMCYMYFGSRMIFKLKKIDSLIFLQTIKSRWCVVFFKWPVPLRNKKKWAICTSWAVFVCQCPGGWAPFFFSFSYFIFGLRKLIKQIIEPNWIHYPVAI